MALSQSIDTPFGVPATYWTITRFTIDRVNLSISMDIAGYADQQAEADKKSPLAQRNYNVNFAENPPSSTNSTNLINQFINKGIPTQVITPELIGLFQTISEFGYNLTKLSEEFSSSQNI